MPQMAPLNWLTLMIYFIFIFIIFNLLNYYSFLYSQKTSTINKLLIKLNWKW